MTSLKVRTLQVFLRGCKRKINRTKKYKVRVESEVPAVKVVCTKPEELSFSRYQPSHDGSFNHTFPNANGTITLAFPDISSKGPEIKREKIEVNFNERNAGKLDYYRTWWVEAKKNETLTAKLVLFYYSRSEQELEDLHKSNWGQFKKNASAIGCAVDAYWVKGEMSMDPADPKSAVDVRPKSTEKVESDSHKIKISLPYKGKIDSYYGRQIKADLTALNQLTPPLEYMHNETYFSNMSTLAELLVNIDVMSVHAVDAINSTRFESIAATFIADALSRIGAIQQSDRVLEDNFIGDKPENLLNGSPVMKANDTINTSRLKLSIEVSGQYL